MSVCIYIIGDVYRHVRISLWAPSGGVKQCLNITIDPQGSETIMARCVPSDALFAMFLSWRLIVKRALNKKALFISHFVGPIVYYFLKFTSERAIQVCDSDRCVVLAS